MKSQYTLSEKFTMLFIAIAVMFLGLNGYFHFVLDRGIEVEVDLDNRQYVHRQYIDMFDWLAGDVTEYTVPFEAEPRPNHRDSIDHEPQVESPKPL